MFVRLMSCLCRWILLCSSSVSSAGTSSTVCLVALVKGMSLCISVISPPPSPVVLSFRIVVYPGNLGVLCLSLTLVSWMAAMCMLCCSRWCLSCCILFVMRPMLCCSMFSFVMVCVCWLGSRNQYRFQKCRESKTITQALALFLWKFPLP